MQDSIELVIAANPGAFSVQECYPGGVEGLCTGGVAPFPVEPGADAMISRWGDGRGFILNTSPRFVRFAYVKDDGEVVGPTADYLAPGHMRELGIAPGMRWRVIVC